jgi:hypothetical protein
VNALNISLEGKSIVIDKNSFIVSTDVLIGLPKQTIIQKIQIPFLFIVLGLSIIALVAELLPEVEAKIIVVPTLVLVIGLIAMNLRAEMRKY